MSGSRTYKNAIEALNSLQSNAATLDFIRANGGRLDKFAIPESIDYLKRIGYSPEDLNALNVIHITGTKGKGSTSAFTSSILSALAPNAKIGLYTSPHMVAVRERIRINGKPLDEDKFARYFFEVWDRFEQNPERLFEHTTDKPAYFRYLTTMAFHVFLQEKVDATILEVGVGGTYDSTNVVPKPLVTGVTPLGIDHIFVLGKTIEEIAHQKGGIYKPGVPALTVEQPPNAMQVLRLRTSELKASTFSVVQEHPQLQEIKLGLAGAHQRSNASLAVALVRIFLTSDSLPSAFKDHALTSTPEPSTSEAERAVGLSHVDSSILSPTPLPDAIVTGLENTRWPGRCQQINDREPSRKGVTWYLDGAHTVESLECCGEWFVDAAFKVDTNRQRVLVFNCTGGRSAESLFGSLTDSMSDRIKHQGFSDVSKLFDHVIFCTNVTYADGGFSGDLTSKAIDPSDLAALKTQYELAEAWKRLAASSDSKASSSTQVHVLPSIQHAVELIAQEDGRQEGTDVLVTGSLHLVGGVFEVANLTFAL